MSADGNHVVSNADEVSDAPAVTVNAADAPPASDVITKTPPPTKADDSAQELSDDDLAVVDARAPLRITRWIVDRPWLLIAMYMALFFFTAGIIVATNSLQLSESSREWLVHGDSVVRESNSLYMALKDLDRVTGDEVRPVRSKRGGESVTHLMYRAHDDNILTVAALADIRAFELKVQTESQWTRHCAADVLPAISQAAQDGVTITEGPGSGDAYEPPCADDAWKSLAPQYVNATTQAEVDAISKKLHEAGTWTSFFDRDFAASVEAGAPASKYVRSMLSTGLPFGDKGNGKQFANEDDDRVDQHQRAIDFGGSIFNYADDAPSTHFDTLAGGIYVYEWYQMEQVVKDLTWAVFSVTVVFIVISFHTGSLFIAGAGITGVVGAFPIAFFVQFFIFQVDYFQFLNTMIVFVILGIGADDVFVFVDAWNQVKADNPLLVASGDYHSLMDITYRRASHAMLVTSFTTAVAFFSTSISPLIPIAAFGIFSGLVVLFNFLAVITLLPSCVIVWERHVRYKCFQWPCCRQTPDDVAAAKPAETVELVDAATHPPPPADDDVEAGRTLQVPDDASGTASHGSSKHSGSSKRRHRVSKGVERAVDEELTNNTRLERWFHFKWHELVLKGRYLIIGFFAAFFIAFVVLASDLGPLTEEEQWFPDGHPLTEARNWLDHKFVRSSTDFQVDVSFIWGIRGFDSTSDFWEADDLGTVLYQPDFRVSTPAQQQFILDACDTIRNFDATFESADDDAVRCFMEGYKAYRESQSLSFPAVFDADDAAAQDAAFMDDLTVFLQTSEGVEYAVQQDIGQSRDGTLLFVKVYAVAKLRAHQARAKTLPAYRQFEGLRDLLLEDGTPLGLSTLMQTNLGNWAWMASEEAFKTSAINGVTVSLCVALLVLCASTMNVVVSMYAIATIGGIVVTVIGTMTLLGWELGVTESISLVILVGFSVDYCVHIVNSYVHSKQPTREHKTRDALREMGISIVAGAITTLTSASFLFGAEMIFFNKFAILMVLTVSVSLIWTLVFLTAVLDTIGPLGHTGDIATYYRRCCNRVSPAVVEGEAATTTAKVPDAVQ